MVRILFIGDLVGRSARRFLAQISPLLKDKFKPDLIIANGENSAGGLGITCKTAAELFDSGVDVITTGNHVWDKKEAIELLNTNDRIIRPLNFSSKAPGRGYVTINRDDKTKILIVNLQGRVFMEPVADNPFVAIDTFLNKHDADIILVDFHAEATAEKQALGFFLNGRVSAVLCTHTHIPPSDLRILSQGTAYQTDVGMTGALNSIIGMKSDPIINKFVTGVNHRFEVAKNSLIMDITILDIDSTTGKTQSVEAMRLYESTYQKQLS